MKMTNPDLTMKAIKFISLVEQLNKIASQAAYMYAIMGLAKILISFVLLNKLNQAAFLKTCFLARLADVYVIDVAIIDHNNL